MNDGTFSFAKEQVLKLLDDKNYTLVDVLGKASYEKAHIRGSISVPFDELEEHGWVQLAGKKVITYCHGRTCQASERAAQILRDHGVEAYFYSGGLEEWIDEGLPLEGDLVPPIK